MKYTLMVNEGPYQHQSSDTALQFARAALEKGHEIFRVFFYHDGVNNGTRLAVPPKMIVCYKKNGLNWQKSMA